MQSAHPRTYISSNHHCQTKHHMHVRNTSRAWGIDVLFVRLSYISLRIRFSTFHRKLIKEWRGKRFNRTHTPQFLYPNLLPIHHFVAHQCPSHHGWQAGVSSSHRIQLASTHHTLPALSTQRRLDQQRRIIHKKSSKLVYISVCAVIGESFGQRATNKRRKQETAK